MTWQPDYVTSSTLKSYLRIGDTDDDAFIALWITAASRSVDGFCQRQFGQVAAAEQRTYTAVYDRWIGSWVADIDDIQDITDLAVVDSDDAAIADYTLVDVNALKRGKPYTGLRVAPAVSCAAGSMTIKVTGLWGWSAVPSAVSAAVLLQAGRLQARRENFFGTAGSPDQGSEVKLLTATLDPDLRTTLRPYRREWWAA